MLGIGLLLLGKLLLAAQLLIFLLRHFPSRRRVAAAPPTCGTACVADDGAGGRGRARARPRAGYSGTLYTVSTYSRTVHVRPAGRSSIYTY